MFFLRVDHHLDASNRFQTKNRHKQGQETGWRHIKTCLDCWYVFFFISFFSLLIILFTGSTNILLHVDHHLDMSNSYQTEYGHEQEQEMGWRHIKTGRLWRCKGRLGVTIFFPCSIFVTICSITFFHFLFELSFVSFA